MLFHHYRPAVRKWMNERKKKRNEREMQENKIKLMVTKRECIFCEEEKPVMLLNTQFSYLKLGKQWALGSISIAFVLFPLFSSVSGNQWLVQWTGWNSQIKNFFHTVIWLGQQPPATVCLCWLLTQSDKDVPKLV